MFCFSHSSYLLYCWAYSYCSYKSYYRLGRLNGLVKPSIWRSVVQISKHPGYFIKRSDAKQSDWLSKEQVEGWKLMKFSSSVGRFACQSNRWAAAGCAASRLITLVRCRHGIGEVQSQIWTQCHIRIFTRVFN